MYHTQPRVLSFSPSNYIKSLAYSSTMAWGKQNSGEFVSQMVKKLEDNDPLTTAVHILRQDLKERDKI